MLYALELGFVCNGRRMYNWTILQRIVDYLLMRWPSCDDNVTSLHEDIRRYAQDVSCSWILRSTAVKIDSLRPQTEDPDDGSATASGRNQKRPEEDHRRCTSNRCM